MYGHCSLCRVKLNAGATARKDLGHQPRTSRLLAGRMVWFGSSTRNSTAVNVIPHSDKIDVESPSRVSESSMKMSVELKDRFVTCVSIEAAFEAPHDLVFEILANPANHTAVFASIKDAKHRLVEDKGAQKTWSLDYKTAWKFWKVGGVCDTNCYMWTDQEKGTVRFRLREPGFLKVYEGTWTIRPAMSPLSHVHTNSSHSSLDHSLTPSTSTSTISSLTPGDSLCNDVSFGSHSGGSSVSGPCADVMRDMGSMRVEHHASALTASVSMQSEPRSHPLSSLDQWLGDASHAVSPISNWVGQLRGVTDAGDAGWGNDSPEKPLQQPQFSVVTVENMMAPKIQPPYPLNLALKSNAADQIQEMVECLISAAQSQARHVQHPPK